jgi:recombinational DNA repair protein (RecF pathway)
MNESIKKGMYVIFTTCYKCGQPMNAAMIYREDGNFCGPETFSEEEKRVAKDHGVIIDHHYSGTRQESYNANTCPHCNAFIGEWFLYDDYVTSVMYGDCNYKLVDTEENKVITYFVMKKPTRNRRKK